MPMQYLFDKSPATINSKIDSDLIRGQLLTPLTNYKIWDGEYGIDNGAYSGFDSDAFQRLLKRARPHVDRCLFVTVPDIVGNARRTLELWKHRHEFIPPRWKYALVAQDGIEDLDIPWPELDVLFIGGMDPWKHSRAADDVIRTSLTLGKPVHVGRVNTPKRFKRFDELGCATCDGTGASIFSDEMLGKIEIEMNRSDPTLFVEMEMETLSKDLT